MTLPSTVKPTFNFNTPNADFEVDLCVPSVDVLTTSALLDLGLDVSCLTLSDIDKIIGWANSFKAINTLLTIGNPVRLVLEHDKIDEFPAFSEKDHQDALDHCMQFLRKNSSVIKVFGNFIQDKDGYGLMCRLVYHVYFSHVEKGQVTNTYFTGMCLVHQSGAVVKAPALYDHNDYKKRAYELLAKCETIELDRFVINCAKSAFAHHHRDFCKAQKQEAHKDTAKDSYFVRFKLPHERQGKFGNLTLKPSVFLRCPSPDQLVQDVLSAQSALPLTNGVPLTERLKIAQDYLFAFIRHNPLLFLGQVWRGYEPNGFLFLACGAPQNTDILKYLTRQVLYFCREMYATANSLMTVVRQDGDVLDFNITVRCTNQLHLQTTIQAKVLVSQQGANRHFELLFVRDDNDVWLGELNHKQRHQMTAFIFELAKQYLDDLGD